MTRDLAAGALAALLAVAFSGCSGTSSSVPSHDRSKSSIQQPSGQDPGGGTPPAGSTYTNTQCSASDASCAGPWTSSSALQDNWETASPNGNGSFQQRVVCASTESCANLGYTGISEEVVYSWVSNYGGASGPADSMTADYQTVCDPNANDAYPDGCNPFNVSFVGKNAQPGNTCVGSPLAIGFPIAGADSKANDIVQIYAVRGLGLAAHVGGVGGYVYETGQGSYWFQPNMSVSAGVGVVGASSSTPYFGINGTTPDQLTAAFNKAIQVMGVTTPPIEIAKNLNANLKFTAIPCFQNPWNGTYTSSFRRHN